jgi:hypothetical protein
MRKSEGWSGHGQSYRRASERRDNNTFHEETKLNFQPLSVAQLFGAKLEVGGKTVKSGEAFQTWM